MSLMLTHCRLACDKYRYSRLLYSS